MMTLSKREEKLIRSLSLKKYRDEHGLFVAEGQKVIAPLLPYFDLEFLVLVAENGDPKSGFRPYSDIGATVEVDGEKLRSVSMETLSRLSSLNSPQGVLAVFRIPCRSESFFPHSGVTVALDEVQNPGNLGTIIRLCDWLGIKDLMLSPGCADPYSPKVVQATAGALGNVNLHFSRDLESDIRRGLFGVIIGTALNGEPLRGKVDFPKGNTCVLFGNEGHGLSKNLLDLCTDLVLIPAAPTAVSESLNVSLSAAILLSRLV